MGLLDFLTPKKERTLWDELQDNPIFQEQKALYDAMSVLTEDGCGEDEIPGGFGEFGHDISNPIPTNTPYGSISYMSRLRTPDGRKVMYQRMGCRNSETLSMPVDIYRITTQDGEPLATLYVSCWHKLNSAKAPRGLRLLKY
jgi:hypothetical protein